MTTPPAAPRANVPQVDIPLKGSKNQIISWILRICSGPKALPVFGLVSAIESSFFPFPLDLAMGPLVIARPRQTWLIVLVGALGSAIGAMVGYAMGFWFFAHVGERIVNFYGMQEQFINFKELYLEIGAPALVVAGLTPVPFNMAAILSGVVGMNFVVFGALAFAVRFVRFALMALLFRVMGGALNHVLHHHGGWFLAASLAAMALGIFFLPTLIS